MFEIVTYGGGEFLSSVLNGVASLFGSNDYIFALKMCATLAALGILISAAFQGRIPDLKWILIMISIYVFAFVPKVAVTITDTVERTPGFPISTPTVRVVGNVPMGLAFTASFASGMRDYFTRGFETVFALPNEVSYRRGGALFAQGISESAVKSRVSDPNLNMSLSNFWKDCVFFDIALGFYSMTDLAKADNLQNFLANNTAAGRAYEHINSDGSKAFQMCKASISSGGALYNAIAQEAKDQNWLQAWQNNLATKPTNANALISSNAAAMPIAFQYLTGVSMTSSQLLAQTTLANSFQDGLVAFANAAEADSVMQGYAAAKAESERGITFTVMGKLAGKMLPLLNIIAEGLLYAAAPIIGVMLMFPAAGKVAMGYIMALVWLALWAPLFAVLHFFSMKFTAISGVGAVQICDAANVCSGHLNMYTMGGLKQSFASAAAISGYFATLIPMVAWMVVSRSGAMMAGLAGRVMDGYAQPVSHAATEAAGGNIQMGNMSYQNLSAFQQNTAPSQTSGSSMTDNGRTTHRETSSGGIDQVRIDSGPASMNAQSSIQSAIASQHSQAHKATESASESVTLADTNRFNTLVAAENSVSHATGTGKASGIDSRTSESQTLANVSNAAQSFAQKHGVNEAYLTSALSEMGIKLGVGVSGGMSAQAKNSQDYQKAEEYAQRFQTSQEFRDSLDKSQSAYLQRMANDRSEVANAGKEAVSNAAEASVMALNQHSAALAKEEAISKVANDLVSRGAAASADLSGYLKGRATGDYADWETFQVRVNQGDAAALKQLDGYVKDYADSYVQKAVTAKASDIEAQGSSTMTAVRAEGAAALTSATLDGTNAVNQDRKAAHTTVRDGHHTERTATALSQESTGIRDHQSSLQGAYGARVIQDAGQANAQGDDGKNYIERRFDEVSHTNVAGRAAGEASQQLGEIADRAAVAITDSVKENTGIDLNKIDQAAGIERAEPGTRGLLFEERGKAASAADNQGDNISKKEEK